MTQNYLNSYLDNNNWLNAWYKLIDAINKCVIK